MLSYVRTKLASFLYSLADYISPSSDSASTDQKTQAGPGGTPPR